MLFRFCGGLLGNDANQNAGTTVYTKTHPFQLGVNFDGSEVDHAAAENSRGFRIFFTQTQC